MFLTTEGFWFVVHVNIFISIVFGNFLVHSFVFDGVIAAMSLTDLTEEELEFMVRFSFRVLCSRLLGSRVSVRVIVVAFLVLLDLLVFANLCRRLAAADFSENSLRVAPAVRNFAREKFLRKLKR